ncbi:MAG: hypothetical protein ABTQ32_12805 [Myxococcaceae bacterium]
MTSTRLATHTRYLPSNAQERLTLLSNAAHSDEALGLLQSAETNLRLALCFVPGDRGVTEALDRVVATRERLRRASSI